MFSRNKKQPKSPEATKLVTSFLDYEKQNNIFLNSLKKNSDLLSIVQYILDKDAALLVPHSAVLEGAKITAPFVRAHTILLNPEDSTQFVTLHSTFGVFAKITVEVDEEEEKTVNILQPDLPPSDPITPLTDLPAYIRANRNCWKDSRRARNIPVLREGEITLRGKSVPIFIIAEPLVSAADPVPTLAVMGAAPAEREASSRTSLPGVSSPSSEQSVPALTIAAHGKPEPASSVSPPAPVLKTHKPSSSGSNIQVKDLISNVNTGLFPEPAEAKPKEGGFLQKLQQAPDIYRAVKAFTNAFLQKRFSSIEEQRDQVRSFVCSVEDMMFAHPLWKGLPADEIDAASESLERLITTKLHPKIFGSLQDSEKDKALHKRMQQLQFIRPEYLDIHIPGLDELSQFELAKAELAKINSYKTPRDKIICIFNCCKVVYSICVFITLSQLLNKNESNPAGADDFLPLLIYVTLKTNPPNIHANMLYLPLPLSIARYISHFRAPDRMNTEAGYYFTHLFSTITFIETLDATSLSIDPAEFARLLASSQTAEPLPPLLPPPPSAKPREAPASAAVPLAPVPSPAPAAVPAPPAAHSTDDVLLMSFEPVTTASASISLSSSSSSLVAVAVQSPSPRHSSSAVLTPDVLAPSPSPAPATPTPSSLSPALDGAIDFASANPEDLRMHHVPMLLEAYKQLLSENKCLRLILQENNIHYQ